jgi:hypothetical protein
MTETDAKRTDAAREFGRALADEQYERLSRSSAETPASATIAMMKSVGARAIAMEAQGEPRERIAAWVELVGAAYEEHMDALLLFTDPHQDGTKQ